MKERLRNIGLEAETHKALKMLCAENDWTMTQAVEHLLERLKDERKGSGSKPSKSSGTTGGKPGQAD
jgi:hypothetical protein